MNEHEQEYSWCEVFYCHFEGSDSGIFYIVQHPEPTWPYTLRLEGYMKFSTFRTIHMKSVLYWNNGCGCLLNNYFDFSATSLIKQVIDYASTMTNCGAVYLHVISYNKPAIHLYQKMLFIRIRKLRSFYYINNKSYDAYLFIYYVKRGQSPCLPM